MSDDVTTVLPPEVGMPRANKKQPPEDIMIIPDSDNDGTPLRPIFCLKLQNRMDIGKYDDIDDCFIVDFDPDGSGGRPVNPNLETSSPEADDVVLVSEKGPVACRDFPHSRYQCATYAFDKTPHQKYCPRCYCYVCDVAAPCQFWEVGASPHCHAIGHVQSWKAERAKMRGVKVVDGLTAAGLVLQRHG